MEYYLVVDANKKGGAEVYIRGSLRHPGGWHDRWITGHANITLITKTELANLLLRLQLNWRAHSEAERNRRESAISGRTYSGITC